CGPGTTLQNGQCVPTTTITCGPGTVLQGSQCVPTSQLTCGPGTVAASGQCVPNLATICAPGTVAVNNTCAPAGGGTCNPLDHVSVCECIDGDADHDGVCDTADACPGFDDRIDVNHNGIPDGCDPTLDAFEPNDVTPYTIAFPPAQFTPTLSGSADLDRFQFSVQAGHMIVFQVCAFLPNNTTVPPLATLDVDGAVLFSNATNANSGCTSPILIPAATTDFYELTLQQRTEWGNLPAVNYQ